MKGIVDTVGNTVGTLGGGLSDTVTGVAGGLGSVAKGAGETVQAGFGGGKETGGKVEGEAARERG